jgi:hypothetical protein
MALPSEDSRDSATCLGDSWGHHRRRIFRFQALTWLIKQLALWNW